MRMRSVAALLFVVAACAPLVASGPQLNLPTSPDDFIQPGTQPGELSVPPMSASVCASCHGYYDNDVEPYSNWVGSLMAQATRDPMFHAALAIAEQDASNSGELCIRCHAPNGWLEGRSTPTDGSGLDPEQGDYEGISCNVCHRLVDPVFTPGENPPEDQGILDDLSLPLTSEAHSGQYIIDPEDRRRGPFNLGGSFPYHDWRQSSHHQEAELCATCHDVSNPVFSREPDGSYKLNNLAEPHPSQDKRDEFPLERTFSEWSRSVYAETAIETDGRFGGNVSTVSTCQDCHMPDVTGYGCNPGLGSPLRHDLPLHQMAGANSWVLEAVRSSYPDSDTGLTDEIVTAAKEANLSMLRNAADLEAFIDGEELVARVVNRTGHKLPTGYAEGRRMWLNVQFRDAADEILAEHGAYDLAAATLDTDTTTVYEILHGLDAYMAGQTGLPEGESFHFVLNNTTLKDNRIPPRGFTNDAFEEVQAEVVAHVYPDQHFWDDSHFVLPLGTDRIDVALYYQTTSREYVEFLRDENTTNDAGQEAYDLWVGHGKSEPVQMAAVTLELPETGCAAPIVYGLGSENQLGGRAGVGWSGEPSQSGGSFSVTLTGGTPNAQGRLVTGRSSASRELPAGTLLVGDIFAQFDVTLSAVGDLTVPVPVTQAQPGLEIFVQFGYTDPGSPSGFALSDALHFSVCR